MMRASRTSWRCALQDQAFHVLCSPPCSPAGGTEEELAHPWAYWMAPALAAPAAGAAGGGAAAALLSRLTGSGPSPMRCRWSPAGRSSDHVSCGPSSNGRQVGKPPDAAAPSWIASTCGGRPTQCKPHLRAQHSTANWRALRPPGDLLLPAEAHPAPPPPAWVGSSPRSCRLLDANAHGGAAAADCYDGSKRAGNGQPASGRRP